METKEIVKEFSIVILASIILALTISIKNTSLIYISLISFIIIIGANVLTKKIVGYMFETKIKINFWRWYQYGLRKDSHFNKPVPMAWLPPFLSLFTQGYFWWLAILEFDVAPKTERVSRKHGLYRFTEVTEWHMGWIAIWGIITNLLLAVIGYITGFETFAKLSIYYTAWSIIPLSSLDGSKILFANKGLWITFLVIAAIFFGWSFII